MTFDPDKVYVVRGVRCPDCGPCSVECDDVDEDGPQSGVCDVCGDRVYFTGPVRADQVSEKLPDVEPDRVGERWEDAGHGD